MVTANDHLGICLWGGRPGAGKLRLRRCLLVIPPNAAIWDYLTNSDNPKPDYQKGMAEWHKTEILANRTTGRVQVAVNGKLVHDYKDKQPAVSASTAPSACRSTRPAPTRSSTRTSRSRSTPRRTA